MDDAWFDQYLYGVILPKKYLDKKTAMALEVKPIVLTTLGCHVSYDQRT